ncbi:MAG: ImuA family protein [Bauldia sp.]
MDTALLTALRREIATIEGRPAGFDDECLAAFAEDGEGPRLGDRDKGKRLPFGIGEIDDRLGGGLPLAALHEFRCEETRDSGSLIGFASGVLARLAVQDIKPILWIEEEMASAEAGVPFGSGIAQFGLDPARLILVRARRPEDALWTFEEGLRCSGLAAALVVIRGTPKVLDLTVSRRLALRSAANGVAGFLLRQSSAPEPGASITRWRIGPCPAGVMDGFAEGIGRPAWRAVIEKNRLGMTGGFDLEWDQEKRSFAPSATADPVARPALSVDRPDRAAAEGTFVAFRKAG